MHISLANIIRSFSEIVAYNEKKDPLYIKLQKKEKAGYPTTPDLIDTKIRGWKAQQEPKVVKMFQDLKNHVDGDRWEEALTMYETDIIPALKKQFGRK